MLGNVRYVVLRASRRPAGECDVELYVVRFDQPKGSLIDNLEWQRTPMLIGWLHRRQTICTARLVLYLGTVPAQGGDVEKPHVAGMHKQDRLNANKGCYAVSNIQACEKSRAWKRVNKRMGLMFRPLSLTPPAS